MPESVSRVRPELEPCPLTKADIRQLIEAIDHFVIGNNAELEPVWQPYIDKLASLARGEALSAPQWQPIETAPRGVDVVLWYPHNQAIHMAQVAWVFDDTSATHWMPLP